MALDHPPTHFLLALLALPPSSLPSSLSSPAIHSSIAALLAHAHSAPHLLRTLLHALVHRLAQLPHSPIDLQLLSLYLAAFLPRNHHLATQVAKDALASNVRLAADIRTQAVPALVAQLDSLPSSPSSSDDEEDGAPLRALLALIRAALPALTHSPTTSTTSAAVSLLTSLSAAYARLGALSGPTLAQDKQRLSLLETAHALVASAGEALAHAQSHATAPALDALKALLAVLLPSSSSSAAGGVLAADLQTHFDLSTPLSAAVTGTVGPAARAVKDQLGALRRSSSSTSSAGDAEWLERLRRARTVGGAAMDGAGMDRGEGTTRADGALGAMMGGEAEKEAEIASALSTLLDLFPSHPTPFLRACLTHPAFKAPTTGETTERVVAALLEGEGLPAELVKLRDAPETAAEGVTEEGKEREREQERKEEQERQNVYADDALFQRGKLLVGGKERKGRAHDVGRPLATPAILSATLKASILAAAEAPSSDSEAEEDYDLAGEDDDGAAAPRMRVGDGELKDSGDEEEGEEMGDGPQGGATAASSSSVPRPSPSSSSSAGAYHPSVLLSLESAYLRSPALFARDAATRRSRERRELRDKTGLGDEQVEGWRSMLERDPKKLAKLRDKHQDLSATSNHPSARPRSSPRPPASSSQPPPQQQQQPPSQSSRGGRGGGGRGGGPGRGGGRGGKGDGGRKESDRAVRGRDKKMARMGAA
ncbi:hypothetical protein JCM10207_003412 [Rhodosporidiobolus poonsookiae]